MRCSICREGRTRPVRHVPAEVCENCGEEYVDEATAAAAWKVGKRRHATA